MLTEGVNLIISRHIALSKWERIAHISYGLQWWYWGQDTEGENPDRYLTHSHFTGFSKFKLELL